MNKRLGGILLAIVIVLLVVGLIGRSTYGDFNELENPLELFAVGQISESLLEVQLEDMTDTLDDSHYILVVKCLARTEFRFSAIMQEVEVLHVYQGEGLEIGDTFLLGKEGSVISMEMAEYLDGYYSLNTGFVNEMTVGDHYLVFLDRRLDIEEDIYLTGDDHVLAPLFNYREIENAVGTHITELGTFTPYREVAGNEFFIDSLEENAMLKEFKEGLFALYPDVP